MKDYLRTSNANGHKKVSLSPPKEEKENSVVRTIDTGLTNLQLKKANLPKRLSPIVHKMKRKIPRPQNATLEANPIDEKPKKNKLPPAPGVKLKPRLKDSDLISHKVTGIYMKPVKVPMRNLSVPERTKKANKISLF